MADRIERIKLLVELTTAKTTILKLKADDYSWQCHTDKTTKEMLLETLVEIDEMLIELRAQK